ncbi:MAG TPA: NUDIX hydrolase [Gaiellaceae bacterium]|nr:NUDIX hydrolase [Gaiellaceae bacterium]
MIEQPPAVVLVVEDGDEVVLVRQHRPAAGVRVLELPAGSMEPGEEPAAAADRELAEECGLSVEGWTEIGSFWSAPEYSTEFVHVLAGRCSGTADAEHDADEEIEVVRLSPAEALGRLEDAGSVAALGLWMVRNYRRWISTRRSSG